jgi:hypothetical protein
MVTSCILNSVSVTLGYVRAHVCNLYMALGTREDNIKTEFTESGPS